VSRLLSQGETKRVKYISLISFALAFTSACLVAGVILGFLRPLMTFLNIEEGHIGDEAEAYIRPMLYAAPTTVLYYCLSGLAYGLGHIKLYTFLAVIPMFLGVAVTSPILIVGCRLKCTGAGISCVLSYGIPCIVYLIYFAFFDKLIRPFSNKIPLDGNCTIK
jgi:Na+-driven multidrug efflux pump